MKKKLANNLGIKLLSLALATILWIIIVNIEDPVKTRQFYDVPVQVLNESIIEQKGMVYQILEGDAVDVTVRGKKATVDSLKKEDLVITADLKDLSITDSVTINYECPKLTAAGGTLELGKIKNMKVVLEDVAEDRFPVRYQIVGQAEDGYFISKDLVSSKPSMIGVKAAKSVFEQIKTVRVDIDVTNRSDDFTVSLTPKAYDEKDKLISSDSLEFSSSAVQVTVKVLPTKKIPVNVEVKGTPATGFQFIEGTFKPKEIVVAATEKKLQTIESLDISLDISNLSADLDKEILVADYLPDGIIVADDNTSIKVYIEIAKLQKKTITFSTSDIDVKVPADANFSFKHPNIQYQIEVSALPDEINDITIQTIKPFIDLSNKSFGEYNVEISFNGDYSAKFVGNKSVDVILRDITEATPAPTNSPSKEPAQGSDGDELTETPESTPEQTGE